MKKSIRSNTFRDLQILSAVAEFKNYSDAASKLGINASSVSRRIKALEERFKHPLVIKGVRNMRITPEGESLYQTFIQQENAFHEMLSKFQASKKPAKLHSVINIGIPNGVIEYILSLKLPQYLRDNPGVKLNLACHNLNINVVPEKYDFLILRDIPAQSQLIIKKLYEPKFYLYCTPEYKMRYGVPEIPDELSSHMIVHRTRPNSTEYKCFYASNGEETVTLMNSSCFGTNSSTADRNIIMGHDAIVSGTDALYKNELKQGLVIKVLPKYHFFNDFKAFYLIYNKNHLLDPAVQQLMDFVFDVFKEASV